MEAGDDVRGRLDLGNNHLTHRVAVMGRVEAAR